LTLQATVLNNVSGLFTNTIIVSTPSGVTDANLLNNTNSDVDIILTAPDVAITKTGPANVYAGTNYSYTITLTNSGFATASNVVASDALPTNVTFVSASGNGTNNSGVVSWNLGSLAVNATSNLTLTVAAPTSGSVTNMATSTASTPDSNPGNNTSLPVGTTVTPVADLAVGKSAPASVISTSNLTYTISITNLGPSDTSGVIATDTLPSNVTFVSATGGGIHAGTGVSWAMGALNAGQVSNVTLTVQAPASGSITNTAELSSTTLDTNAVNNSSPPAITAVIPLAQSADLVAGKSGPANVFAAGNLTYTVSVTNFGPSAAAGVIVTDALPVGVTFVSATGGGSDAAGVVSWALGTVAANAVTNVSVTVSAPAGGTITNRAGVGSPTPDPVPTNDVSAPVVTAVVPVADVVVLNAGPAVVAAGAAYTNTVTVTNAGPSVATNVVVVDTEPGGAQVTNTVASLGAGVGTNFIVVEVAPGAGPLTNSATGTAGTGDPNPGNNTDIESVTAVSVLLPSADVQVFVTGPTNVTVGDGFSYTVLVTNGGPATAVNTLVTNILPATNLIVFASASGGGVLSSNNVVTWPVIASLTNGQATNLILTVAPAAGVSTNSPTSNPFNFIQTNTTPSVGFLTNKASAFAATFDPNLTNNSASTAYTNAQVQTQIVPGVFSIFIATNTYPTNGLQGVITNTIIPIGPNLFIVGTSAWNPETQLYEENVSVTNFGTAAVYSLRLYVNGPGGVPVPLRSGVTLYNATGTDFKGQYVEYNPLTPLLPGNGVTFLLEFYVVNGLPFTNSLTAVAALAPVTGYIIGVATNNIQHFTMDTRNPDTRSLIQFASIPGRTYTIEYSPDMVTWYVAVPSIVATSTSTAWYDDGPPKTLSKPFTAAVPSRYYRVFLDP